MKRLTQFILTLAIALTHHVQPSHAAPFDSSGSLSFDLYKSVLKNNGRWEVSTRAAFVSDEGFNSTPERLTIRVGFDLDQANRGQLEIELDLDRYDGVYTLSGPAGALSPFADLTYRETEGQIVRFRADEVQGTIRVVDRYFGTTENAVLGSFQLTLLDYGADSKKGTADDRYRVLESGQFSTDVTPGKLRATASLTFGTDPTDNQETPKDLVKTHDSSSCDGGDVVIQPGVVVPDEPDAVDDSGCDAGDSGCDGGDYDNGGSCDGGGDSCDSGGSDLGGGDCGGSSNSGSDCAFSFFGKRQCRKIKRRGRSPFSKGLPFALAGFFLLGLRRRSLKRSA